MDVTSANSPPLARLAPPYDSLEPLSPSDDYLTQPPGPGSSIVWQLGFGSWSAAFDVIRRRSPGMALIVILPPKVEVDSAPQLLRVVEAGRPHSILPFHPEPHLDDLTAVLGREPEDLPVEFMDYLLWRGMNVDMDARRLIRKTVELSLELYTVTALARSLYLSRRALGRRFLKRGLPVPSHWLHFGRILRAALRLQNTDETLASAAYHFGYPDAFAFSNQMYRLTRVRPSEARRFLGWEWLVEAWLQTEGSTGGLSRDLSRTLVLAPNAVLRRKDASSVNDAEGMADPEGPPPRPTRRPLFSMTKAKS